MGRFWFQQASESPAALVLLGAQAGASGDADALICERPHFPSCNTPNNLAYSFHRDTELSSPEFQGNTHMTTFAIFANGTFYGNFEASSQEEAFKAVAAEIGGDVEDDFEYREVTAEEAAAVEAWWAAGAAAAEFPLD